MDERKKKFLTIALFGVAAIAATLLLLDPKTSNPLTVPPESTENPSPITVSSASNQTISTKPVLPNGAANVGKTTRDIFSSPAEYAAMAPIARNGEASGGGGRKIAAGLTPVLTGVIAGEGTRVAILRQGNISRSYRAGESAGAYRIASISARSVTLEGPGGIVVLTMGQ